MVKSYYISGFKVSLLSWDDILWVINKSISTGHKCVIASINVHGVYKFFSDPCFRKLHEDKNTYIHVDGTPIIWWAQIAGIQIKVQNRTAIIDILTPLLRHAVENKLRVFYLGSTHQVCQKATLIIKSKFSSIEFMSSCGYFDMSQDEKENSEVVQKINFFSPHILLVGMGMGRQEKWILENRPNLLPPIIITTGACMELIAGTLSTAPRWLGPLGGEWLYRLFTQPSRVWKRYLIEPWFIVYFILRERLIKRFGNGFLSLK